MDRLSGEAPVRIDWFDGMDVTLLRSTLTQEIDKHTRRVPLDLRGVQGAPPELVELLVEMRRYAVSKSKILSMNWILPPLRDAIDKRLHQPVGQVIAPSANPDSEQASDRAKELLNHVETPPEYDLSKAEKLDRKPLPRKPKALTASIIRYLIMLAGILTTVAIISVVFFFLTSEPPKILDRKTFESTIEGR
ncbi:hypothetical protein LOC67_10885 [Stieleria sp. JC731]|uniref:hypothetical protein n=1 Tax=Pirellulaceae TaxID=2691357 RepID=UPI001E510E94|nr:hypothetical protein [Stieleria sp. JC731]MCC9601051.1 hypothetical protein [Stieleria sp. JC731]